MTITVDPRRKEKIVRYKAPKNQGQSGGANEDMMPDYMNILGMIFSMCGLMMKVNSIQFIAPQLVSDIITLNSSNGVRGLHSTALALVSPVHAPVTMPNR